MDRGSSARGGRNAWPLAAILLAGFVATAVCAIMMTRHSGGVATVWPVNAFLMAALIFLPRSFRAGFTAVCFAALVAVNILANHDSLPMALLFTAFNVAESVGGVWLFNRFCHGRLNTPTRLVRFIAICVAPVSLASALAAASVVAGLYGGEFILVLRQWFAATLLGTSVTLPSLLILLSRRQERLPSRVWVEIVLGLVAGLLVMMAPSQPVRSIGMILIIPALTMFAFQRGAKAAVAGALSLAILALPMVILRSPADTLNGRLNLDERVWMVQVLIAAVFFTALTTALAVQSQHRLMRLLRARSQTARRARVEAEAASRAKTDFLATMSHEIRTPMNSIIGFTEVILRKGGLPDETRRQLNLIERASDALLTVVNDILDFSKVEAGHVQLSPRAVSVRAVAEDTLAIVAQSAKRKDLKLVLDYQAADAVHMTDDHRLRQVLLNLLNNAIKFTEAGGVTLRIAEARGVHRFEVIDTGMGISPEAASRLFQRFSQADSSISRTHGGTGLGLAICKGLVELMDGRIGVNSAPGAGSIFWFELPLTAAEDNVLQSDAETAEIAAAHVLLVDDHPMNRELAVTVLGLLGCSADVAADGYEAIAMANERTYDAILMDVHMPRMDGLAATRAIRSSNGPSSRVPIIAMSADVMPEQVTRCLEAGMVDSVGKPINIEGLHLTLSRWIGRDAEGEALAA